MPRAALATSIKLVLSVLFAIGLAGLWSLTGDEGPAAAFLDQGPRLIFAFMWPGLLVWAGLSIVGMVRRRGLGWGVGWSVLAAAIAGFVNLVVFAVIGFTAGGWGAFVIVLAILGGMCFLIGAVVASVVAHLLVRVPARDAAPAAA